MLRILAANPGQVEAYRGGKEGLLGFFVGQVMKETGGKANTRAVSELLREAAGLSVPLRPCPGSDPGQVCNGHDGSAPACPRGTARGSPGSLPPVNPLFRKTALIAASLGLLVSLFIALSPDDDEETATTSAARTAATTTEPERRPRRRPPPRRRSRSRPPPRRS